MSKKLIMTVGPQACGKTTWAEKYVAENQGWVNVNRDDIRFALFGQYHGKQVNEYIVQQEQERLVQNAFESGANVIVSDMNLSHTAVWENMAAQNGATVGYKYFDGVPLAELFRRNANRDRKVPENVIRDCYNKYRDMRMQPYVEPFNGREAYMCDIDGTLAGIPKGGRSPFDMTRVKEDFVHSHVAAVIRALWAEGYRIIIMNGRDASAEADTRAWLNDNRIMFTDLFCRPVGNLEKDSIVKYDLFKLYVEPEYRVRGVFDDRDQVVKMWRKIGVPCFQVAEGNF